MNLHHNLYFNILMIWGAFGSLNMLFVAFLPNAWPAKHAEAILLKWRDSSRKILGNIMFAYSFAYAMGAVALLGLFWNSRALIDIGATNQVFLILFGMCFLSALIVGGIGMHIKFAYNRRM